AHEIDLWIRHQPESELYLTESIGDVVVTEGRWGWPAGERRLSAPEADVLRFCAEIRSRAQLQQQLAARHGGPRLDAAIEALQATGLMLAEGDNLLSLPLRQPGFRSAPSWKEIRAAIAAQDGSRAAAAPAA